ncbi:MAG: thermonuclease family protein [Candidatus Omnitrophica bacterium]|nr:thermonuclease family protein [Candidatus Omnitrophota bacterium]
MTIPAKQTGYPHLLANIRREIERGLIRFQALLEQQKVNNYWSVGRLINTHLRVHHVSRGEIGVLYQQLSRDLAIHERTLQQCEQFFRYFPKNTLRKGISWSHYRFLLSVSDEQKRLAWLDRILKENISADMMRLALMPTPKATEFNLKAPPRGQLFTYRLLPAEEINSFVVPWFVDIGFAGRCEAPRADAKLNNKYIYTSHKLKSGYQLKVSSARADELFTFQAKLKRVIDGDTFLVNVDQGFGYWSEQRLRLRGVDCPEMSTLAGQRAKVWAQRLLKDSNDIVVKTYKSDNWDRYLVDLYYLPKEKDMAQIAAQGIYFNAKALEDGMATLWK